MFTPSPSNNLEFIRSLFLPINSKSIQRIDGRDISSFRKLVLHIPHLIPNNNTIKSTNNSSNANNNSINNTTNIDNNNNNNSINKDNNNISNSKSSPFSSLSLNSPVEASLGNSLVHACLRPKAVKPKSGRPNEGILNFSVDTNFLRANSEAYSASEKLTELRIKIIRYVEMCLKESKALDINSLCIIPGKMVWKITVEINIIKYDGNILDLAVIAALVAWQTYKIPFLRIDKIHKKLYYESFLNLPIIHMPISVTFGIFVKDKDNQREVRFIVDPNMQEESVMNGTFSICANIFKEICYMDLSTNKYIDNNCLCSVLSEVDRHVNEIHKIIREFVSKENLKIDKKINKNSKNGQTLSEIEQDMVGVDNKYIYNDEIEMNNSINDDDEYNDINENIDNKKNNNMMEIEENNDKGKKLNMFELKEN